VPRSSTPTTSRTAPKVVKPARCSHYNADLVVAGGGDTALSPDNVDASGQDLMINEDGTTESRAVMVAKGRDGTAVEPGVWETSEIIDASALFGADTWLSDVQAHPPTTPPGGPTVTVEYGQRLVMTRAG
jgi:hypothetical protein